MPFLYVRPTTSGLKIRNTTNGFAGYFANLGKSANWATSTGIGRKVIPTNNNSTFFNTGLNIAFTTGAGAGVAAWAMRPDGLLNNTNILSDIYIQRGFDVADKIIHGKDFTLTETGLYNFGNGVYEQGVEITKGNVVPLESVFGLYDSNVNWMERTGLFSYIDHSAELSYFEYGGNAYKTIMGATSFEINAFRLADFLDITGYIGMIVSAGLLINDIVKGNVTGAMTDLLFIGLGFLFFLL